MKIFGLGINKGLAIGKVYVLKEESAVVKRIEGLKCEDEINKFKHAREIALNELTRLKEKTKIAVGEKESEIFEAHKMMIEDIEFIEGVERIINDEEVNVEYAIQTTTSEFVAIFEALENEYMRERASDLKDINKRLLNILAGIKNDIQFDEDTILACKDLKPSDSANLDPSKVKGIITEIGGETSHSAIISKSIGIPHLSGIKDIEKVLKNDDVVILDSYENVIEINPTSGNLNEAKAKIKELTLKSQAFESEKYNPAITEDGEILEIAANIADSKGIEEVIASGAEGIGLFRSEFIYMNRNQLPTVDEQIEHYKKVLQAFGERPVVIRTFDIGGDKQVDYLNIPKEENPFLGYRAIRICLDRKELFKNQLEALLRASVYGNLKIMFPMISSIEEVHEVKAVLEEVKVSLIERKLEFKNVEIGMMVEIPSVATIADKFAKYVDFFSIGTNDLLQYTVAVDRMNDSLSKLYNKYHPALLLMIKNVAEAAHRNNIWVGICGEAAADTLLTPFYVGIGVTELSMSKNMIPEVKSRIRTLNKKSCEAVVEKVMELDTAVEIESYLKRL